MIRIKDALGNGWNVIRLQDDETPYGGKSHSKETLGEFMLDVNISPFDSVNKLQEALQANGLMMMSGIDSYVQNLIEERIKDIEDELDVDIIDWHWDYYIE